MKDIKDYSTFKKIERINKGWSGDKKYYVEANDGKQMLLRISDIKQYDRKKFEFEMMDQIAKRAFQWQHLSILEYVKMVKVSIHFLPGVVGLMQIKCCHNYLK